MIDTGLDVMYGSSLPFQQVGCAFPDLPSAAEGMLAWDDDQRLLVITAAVALGAVGFRAEEHPNEPALLYQGWQMLQEVSVRFDDVVKLRDLEADTDLLEEPLLTRPGRYRMRLYATGRDSGVELQESGDDLTERYLLQFWPESQWRPPTPMQPVPSA
ncbi:hypothetical protein [Nocardia suismassiliense]|uniref:hypothetical protein n=1 Tax=Nocardia suismassiliense TaxID=2077092 RepID=UPI000D1DFD50|nr:hypothetical protein [Nocardia suismassiliense]